MYVHYLVVIVNVSSVSSFYVWAIARVQYTMDNRKRVLLHPVCGIVDTKFPLDDALASELEQGPSCECTLIAQEQ